MIASNAVTATSTRARRLAAWVVRVTAVVVCVLTGAAIWRSMPGPAMFSSVLGVRVTTIPNEHSQYLVHAARESVDFTRLGTIHLDLGFTVGVTLHDGTQVGFRFRPETADAEAPGASKTFMALAAGAMYVLLHFLAFAALLRRMPGFQTERGIFRYHVVSILAVAVAAAVLFAREPGGVQTAAGVTAIHGLYSLSFLELWSLAQGGYSLAMLRHLSDGTGRADDVMRDLGREKTTLRLASLTRLGILRQSNDRVELTSLGRLGARAQAAVLAIVNSRVGE